MLLDNRIFVFIFFMIFTEIINYLFNTNIIEDNSLSIPCFIVMINNIEMKVIPFFIMDIIENEDLSLEVKYQNISVKYIKVENIENNKAYLKYKNNYYSPEDGNLLVYSPYLQLNQILNSINICGINELFIYINNNNNNNDSTSDSTSN